MMRSLRSSYAFLLAAGLVACTAFAPAAEKPAAHAGGHPAAATKSAGHGEAAKASAAEHGATSEHGAAGEHEAEGEHGAAHHGYPLPHGDSPIVAQFAADLESLTIHETPHEIPSIFDLINLINYHHHEMIQVRMWGAHYEAAAKAAGDDAALHAIETYLAEREAYFTEHKYTEPGIVSRASLWIYRNRFGIISFFVVLCYAALAIWMYKNIALRPGRVAAAGTTFVEGFYKLIADILGSEDEARRYTPFLGTLFLFILALNYLSLVPFMASPSAFFFNNLGLSIAVFLYCQYIAFTRLGGKKYLMHLMGDPTDKVSLFFGVFPIFFLEVMGEFVKPISLSLRLFGNILAEDILLCTFAGSMGVAMLGLIPYIGVLIPSGLPLHLILAPLIILFSTIQALVFTFLSAVFISLKLPHGHHDEEHAH